MSNLPTSVRSLLSIGASLLITLFFLVLPRRVAFVLFVLLVVYPVMTWLMYTSIAFILRVIGQVMTRIRIFLFTPEASDLDSRRLRPIHLLEIIIILMMTVFATRFHFNFHPDMRVRGHEIEWLTGGGELAHQSLQEYGTIPLWNPYYRQGEPLVDNAFSYLLNPFSSVPHLLMGATQGTKYAVTINAGLAAVGGWFLAWVLGLTGAGRITLALLILGKGNMHTNFDAGYYQLAIQQVYFPWVFAGMIAVFKTTRRWAIVLTAVSASLMFFAGNLWHLLPTAISMAVLFVVYGRSGRRFNMVMVRRMMWVTLITVGLCSVTLLSIVAHYGLIDAHPDEMRAGWEVLEPNRTYLLPFMSHYDYATEDLSIIVPKSEYINDEYVRDFAEKGGMHFYYSYVAPWWFVLMILLPVPLLWRYRKTIPDNWRLWVVGLCLYVFFTMWGMGGTPLFMWLYKNVPSLAQWRFVPRIFGMASFWIAVLVALRTDALLRTLVIRWEEVHKTRSSQAWQTRLYLGLVVAYVFMTGLVLVEVNEQWQDEPMVHMEPQFKQCAEWLNEAEPNAEHAIWVHGYNRMTDLIKNDIRMVNIEADFLPSTAKNTIGDPRIDARLRYSGDRLLEELDMLDYFVEEGYRPIKASPPFHRIEHCIYRNEDYALPYAFTFALDDATTKYPSGERNPELINLYIADLETSPVIGFNRLYDTIAVRAQADSQSQQVLAIQELAYPGWEVWIDGELQTHEIFAKWNAVKLPLDDKIHDVLFLYRPPLLYLGAIITFITVFGCIIYLLRIDRFFSRK